MGGVTSRVQLTDYPAIPLTTSLHGRSQSPTGTVTGARIWSALSEGFRGGIRGGGVGPGGVVVFLNTAGGRWQRSADALPEGFGDSLAVGDWNRDGRVDVALGLRRTSAADLVQLQQPDGTLASAHIAGLPSSAFLPAVATLAINEREYVALAYRRLEGRFWTSGIELVEWSATDGWQRQTLVAGLEDEVSTLAACNVNQDNTLDLVAGSARGETLIFLTDGDERTEEPREADLVLPSFGCRVYSSRCHNLDNEGADELILGFAGEASEACPTAGSLQVWRFVPNEADPP